MNRLTIDDIADLRAYERDRESLRAGIIALKRIRRIQIGPLVSVVFENRETVRFQIQEMARAEKIVDDAQLQEELDVYNPLVPGRGECRLTLFVELTSEAQLREWLPKLVGIERAVFMRIEGAGGGDVLQVRAEVDAEHSKQLTREQMTASVHYVHLKLPDDALGSFAWAAVALGIDHPAYRHEAVLSEALKASIAADWD